MKKAIAIIVFLFVIFNSSFSLAKNDEKITVEEIENALFGRFEKKNDNETWKDHFNRIEEKFALEMNEKEKEEERKYNTKKDNETYVEWDKRRKEILCKGFGSRNRAKCWSLQDSDKYRVKKRIQGRRIAKCMHKYNDTLLKSQYGFKWLIWDYEGEYLKVQKLLNIEVQNKSLVKNKTSDKKCFAKVIRATNSYSEKSKKRRPGDIFYALEAIKYLVDNQQTRRKFTKMFDFDEVKKPVVCEKKNLYRYGDTKGYSCRAFTKSTLKKIEKFKKNPSNEKVLGKELIKYIKSVRMIRSIEEKIGTGNYALLGDMLNALVADVKKNNISPDLKQRRVLLKKYSLILRGIKTKLDEDNYKSIDKDVSKLSKTYENLNTLTTTNEMLINIDKAVDNIFNTNKLVQKSVLNAKDNKEEKLLALASINFMESLIDSILGTIPEKYHTEQKILSQDLFTRFELLELENIINSMMNRSNEIKSAELTKSRDIINKYINTSDVINTLNNLEMKNSISRAFTQDSAAKIANQHIRDNLDKEILKDVKKIIKDMDKDGMSDLTKEASDLAKEVSSVVKEVSGASGSGASTPMWSTTKVGNFNIKHLINASRQGRISWDIGRR